MSNSYWESIFLIGLLYGLSFRLKVWQHPARSSCNCKTETQEIRRHEILEIPTLRCGLATPSHKRNLKGTSEQGEVQTSTWAPTAFMSSIQTLVHVGAAGGAGTFLPPRFSSACPFYCTITESIKHPFETPWTSADMQTVVGWHFLLFPLLEPANLRRRHQNPWERTPRPKGEYFWGGPWWNCSKDLNPISHQNW